MKFFVAKVNLKEQAKLGFSMLRPIQVAYESPKFMLPIRLGMVNADGPQELFVYALTRKGRVEATNYRTVKLPTGMELPVYVKDEFAGFLQGDVRRSRSTKENMSTVFTEYAWDMGWCDPCAADPLSTEELRNLGVFWLGESDSRCRWRHRDGRRSSGRVRRTCSSRGCTSATTPRTFPRTSCSRRPRIARTSRGATCCVTNGRAKRARARPRARYAPSFLSATNARRRALASLTGWDISEIRKAMGPGRGAPEPDPAKWWEKIWKGL